MARVRSTRSNLLLRREKVLDGGPPALAGDCFAALGAARNGMHLRYSPSPTEWERGQGGEGTTSFTIPVSSIPAQKRDNMRWLCYNFSQSYVLYW